MRFVLVLGVLLAAVGCATIDVVHMPDGEPAFQATCYEGKGECMNLAAQQCRGKYHVLGEESQTDAVVGVAAGNVYGGTQETDRLVFRCGELKSKDDDESSRVAPATATAALAFDEIEQQPSCGNGICTLRTDKNGANYCTCKGRRGRAKLECCGD